MLLSEVAAAVFVAALPQASIVSRNAATSTLGAEAAATEAAATEAPTINKQS